MNLHPANQYRNLSFDFKEIKMDEYRYRTMKIAIKDILPRLHREYEMKLQYDTEPFEKIIAGLENQKEVLEKERKKVLIYDEIDEKMADVDQKLKDERQKLSNATVKNPMILLDVKVIKSEYKSQDTIVTLSVPDQMCEFVNQRKDRLSQHLLTLTYVKHDEPEETIDSAKTVNASKKETSITGKAEITEGKKRDNTKRKTGGSQKTK